MNSRVWLVLVVLVGCGESDPFHGSSELGYPGSSWATSLAPNGPGFGKWSTVHPIPRPVDNVVGPRDVRLWTAAAERIALRQRLKTEKSRIETALIRVRLSRLDYSSQFPNRARFHLIKARSLLQNSLPGAPPSVELFDAVQSACRNGRDEWKIDAQLPFHAVAVRYFKRMAAANDVDNELKAEALYRLALLADSQNRPTPHFDESETYASLLEQLVTRFPKSRATVDARRRLIHVNEFSLTGEERVVRSLEFADAFPGTRASADELSAASFFVTANIKSDDPVARLDRVMSILLRHADEHPQSVRIPATMQYGDSYRPPLVWWAFGLEPFTGRDVSSVEQKAVRYFSLEPLGSSGLISQLSSAHTNEVPRRVSWFNKFWDDVEVAAKKTATTPDEVLLGRGAFFMSVPNTTGVKPADSIRPLQKLVSEYPNSPFRADALDLLACVALQNDDFTKASMYWRQLTIDHPTSKFTSIAAWDGFVAANHNRTDEPTYRKELEVFYEQHKTHPMLGFKAQVELGYSWARQGSRDNSKKHFEAAIPHGKDAFLHFSTGTEFDFLNDLAEGRSGWWSKVVRHIVDQELQKAVPTNAAEAIAFYERMVKRYPSPSGRKQADYRQGHFFSLINLLVGNNRSAEAAGFVKNALQHSKANPDSVPPEAHFMLQLWNLRFDYLGVADNQPAEKLSAAVAQAKLQKILQQASVAMLPPAPADDVARDVDSLASLNQSILDPAVVRKRGAADLKRPWYFVGPTGYSPVELHDGQVRHLAIRPPIPSSVDANALWIVDGRFFESTPLDVGGDDSFREDVVKPVFAIDLNSTKSQATVGMARSLPITVDKNSWYRMAGSIGQIWRVSFYDAGRDRVCISRHAGNSCHGDSACRRRWNGVWKNTETKTWNMWR